MAATLPHLSDSHPVDERSRGDRLRDACCEASVLGIREHGPDFIGGLFIDLRWIVRVVVVAILAALTHSLLHLSLEELGAAGFGSAAGVILAEQRLRIRREEAAKPDDESEVQR